MTRSPVNSLFVVRVCFGFRFFGKDRFSVTYFFTGRGQGEHWGTVGCGRKQQGSPLGAEVPRIDESAPSVSLFIQESPVGDDIPVDFSFVAVEWIVHGVGVCKTTSEVEEQVK